MLSVWLPMRRVRGLLFAGSDQEDGYRTNCLDEEGNAIPAPNTDPWDAERVEESIKRLKLNEHDALPEERRRIWQKVSNAIDLYLRAKAAYRPGINPAPMETIERYAREIHDLAKHDAELSMVAWWCVELRNDPCLRRLLR